MDPPEDILDEPVGVAAFHIYAHSWQATDDDNNDIKNNVTDAASKLRDEIVSNDDKEEAVYCAIRALHKFACKAPPALDHALDVMGQAFARLPADIQLLGIKGPEGALVMVKYWLVEWSSRFKGSAYSDALEEEKHSGADIDKTQESTNVYFEQSEISGSVDTVLERVRNLQTGRMEFIVALAMQGRCHSKGISHWSIMDSAVPIIDNILNPSNPNQIPIWGKAEFIACSVLLRGSAKTLISKIPAESREKKLAEWVKGFGRFLHHDPCQTMGGDFALKLHAAVCVFSLFLWCWCLLKITPRGRLRALKRTNPWM